MCIYAHTQSFAATWKVSGTWKILFYNLMKATANLEKRSHLYQTCLLWWKMEKIERSVMVYRSENNCNAKLSIILQNNKMDILCLGTECKCSLFYPSAHFGAKHIWQSEPKIIKPLCNTTLMWRVISIQVDMSCSPER